MEDAELIAYCGIYCGDCFAYKQKVADLSRDIRKELRQSRFDKMAAGMPFKEAKFYGEAYEFLGLLVKLRCKKTCRNEGGNPFCEIRACCRKKEIAGCWECSEIEECKKLKRLIPTHGNALYKNLSIIKRKGAEAFLKGKKHWYTEV